MSESNRFRLVIAIGFASVIALSSFALVAALAVERAATGDSERNMAEYRREVGAARELELGAERLVASARGYLLTGDDSFLASLREARTEFEDEIRSLEDSVRSPGQEHFLFVIRQATQGYRVALDRLRFERTGSLDRTELSSVFEQLLVPRQRALTDAIGTFVAAREERLARGQARVRARAARAERRVIAIGLLAPAVAFLLALLVGRRLSRLYALQKDAAARAETAAARRDELLGIVAHDLRSPLNVIALRAGLLADGAGEKCHEYAAAITRTVARMDHLIGGLLDSAAIESGQLRVIQDNCPVSEIVTSVVELFAPLAAQKAIRFQALMREDGLHVRADRERIIQVLSNLLSNAIRAAGREDRVELRIERSEGRIRFDVCDTGPGIPAEIRPRLFERYARGPGAGSGAVGLGLYIAKAIVAAHGGDMEVASESGKGTVFRIHLPEAGPLACASPRSEAPPTPPPAAVHPTFPQHGQS